MFHFVSILCGNACSTFSFDERLRVSCFGRCPKTIQGHISSCLNDPASAATLPKNPHLHTQVQGIVVYIPAARLLSNSYKLPFSYYYRCNHRIRNGPLRCPTPHHGRVVIKGTGVSTDRYTAQQQWQSGKLLMTRAPTRIARF